MILLKYHGEKIAIMQQCWTE